MKIRPFSHSKRCTGACNYPDFTIPDTTLKQEIRYHSQFISQNGGFRTPKLVKIQNKILFDHKRDVCKGGKRLQHCSPNEHITEPLQKLFFSLMISNRSFMVECLCMQYN